MIRRAVRRPAALAAAGLMAPGAARACAVCFGAEGHALSDGMNAGILALLGVVGFVQAGFVAMFVYFWLRSRRLRQRRDSLHLIRGGIAR